MVQLAATVSDGGGAPWWLAVVIGIATLLLGSGGVSAIVKARSDRRQGIATTEVAEDDALSNRWKSIIEAQTASLLEPLQQRLRDVEEKVGKLEAELEASRKKYWGAVAYIRQLLMWIARHMPESVEHTTVPQAPASLAEDL